MADQQTVTVIGDALIDEMKDEHGVRRFVGGAGLNIAVGLTRLGVKAELIAMVGDDADGEMIRDFLAEYGVTLWASEAPHGTMVATSERVNGEPTYSFNQAARTKAIQFGTSEQAAIARAVFVCVSCYPFDSDQQTQALIDAVPHAPQRLIVDPNPRSGMISDQLVFATNFMRTARLSTLVKVSTEDAEYLGAPSVQAVVDQLLADGVGAVLATFAQDGAAIHTREGISLSRPIISSERPVIDTMGAGDSMLASSVASLLNSDFERTEPAWAALLERALDIAGATVRNPGALLQIPE